MSLAAHTKQHRMNRNAAEVTIAASYFAAAFGSPKKQDTAATKANKTANRPALKDTKRSGWARGQSVTKESAKQYSSSRTTSPTTKKKENRSPKKSNKNKSSRSVKPLSPSKWCPYSGPNASKDRLPRGAPEANLYFAIRAACNKGKDDVAALRKLLPQKVCEGQNFEVWPRQHLLLHGLVKQGCVECVRYLVSDLKFNINQPRQKDGCVPLHIAFYNLQGENLDQMADLLVQLGADRHATNKYGEPPCMFQFKQSSVPPPAGAFWMGSKSASEDQEATQSSPTASETSDQGSPNCVAGLFLADLDTSNFDLGPPATPTPKSHGQGKMFNSDDIDDEWQVTSQMSMTAGKKQQKQQKEKTAAKPLNIDADCWQSVVHKKKININARFQHKVLTPRAQTMTPRAKEMYNAVLGMVMA